MAHSPVSPCAPRVTLLPPLLRFGGGGDLETPWGNPNNALQGGNKYINISKYTYSLRLGSTCGLETPQGRPKNAIARYQIEVFDQPLELETAHTTDAPINVNTHTSLILHADPLVYPEKNRQFLGRVLPTVAKALGLAKEEGGAGGAPAGRRCGQACWE